MPTWLAKDAWPERPLRFPDPFAAAAPHPIARFAAEQLLAELRQSPSRFVELESRGGGKMFGVLVVASPSGELGFLQAFSGMLDGSWHVDGFVPPLFDVARRDAMWPAGQSALRTWELQLRSLADNPRHAQLVDELAALDEQRRQLRSLHEAAKEFRRVHRAALDPNDRVGRGELDLASQRDGTARRQLDQAQAAQRAEILREQTALADTRRYLETQRADESRELMKQVHDHYVLRNAVGSAQPLRELFAPDEPPGGAGDCAAPKLLGHAYRLGLTPVALAEVWWGEPPLTGGRIAGHFYPACRGKCARVLPHMLSGLGVELTPPPGSAPIPLDEPRVIYEDAWLIVVNKPVGLLSVPGRGSSLRDAVLPRLRTRYPEATGPMLVHRLDLDTSGLLVAAKDHATYVLLQRAFALRDITKTYVAMVDGAIAEASGQISLAVRGDVMDRPRQIVDAIDGKAAITHWQVLSRKQGQTRVALSPLTGRTHQLRVHCAHPDGLNAAIVGDRLYGRGEASGARLMLHAERISFLHPHTQRRVECVAPADF